MKFIGLCAVGLSLGVTPTLAAAAGITYDCDTAAEHFSELILPPPDKSFVVSGSVQVRALARSKTYAPLARIHIASSGAPGQPSQAFVGFSLAALPADSKKSLSLDSAVQMLSYNSGGRADEALPLSIASKPGTAQPFKLSFDGRQVTVNLGNETKTLPLQSADPVVRIICSTGEFLFTDVIISPLAR